ncbi:MAG: HD domain-containing protein [Planctomycetota bacterium]|nr:HD domain-containing protein [Planctomycetota bacterium]
MCIRDRSVAATAEAVCRQQKSLRRDILIAGALLHDIGKTEEISAAAGFPYTDAGGLLGHILLGAIIVDRRLSALKDFPETVRLHLLHMIASHHGTVEFGAIKMPATAEAIALHHIECLDAKIQGIKSAIEREPEGAEGNWTEFLRIANSKVYKK